MKRLSERMLTRPGSSDGLPFDISLASFAETDGYRRAEDTERVERFNADVKAWGDDVACQLRASARNMVGRDERLSSSIKPKIRKRRGEAYGIGFTLAIEGIYLEKGASRGHGGFRGGSKWTDKWGNLKKTDKESFYKMGEGGRKAVRWFDPVIEANLPALADIVAEYSAFTQVDATRIYINKE